MRVVERQDRGNNCPAAILPRGNQRCLTGPSGLGIPLPFHHRLKDELFISGTSPSLRVRGVVCLPGSARRSGRVIGEGRSALQTAARTMIGGVWSASVGFISTSETWTGKSGQVSETFWHGLLQVPKYYIFLGFSPFWAFQPCMLWRNFWGRRGWSGRSDRADPARFRKCGVGSRSTWLWSGQFRSGVPDRPIGVRSVRSGTTKSEPKISKNLQKSAKMCVPGPVSPFCCLPFSAPRVLGTRTSRSGDN